MITIYADWVANHLAAPLGPRELTGYWAPLQEGRARSSDHRAENINIMPKSAAWRKVMRNQSENYSVFVFSRQQQQQQKQQFFRKQNHAWMIFFFSVKNRKISCFKMATLMYLCPNTCKSQTTHREYVLVNATVEWPVPQRVSVAEVMGWEAGRRLLGQDHRQGAPPAFKLDLIIVLGMAIYAS